MALNPKLKHIGVQYCVHNEFTTIHSAPDGISAVMVLFLCMPTVLTASTYLIYTGVHGDDPDNQLTPVRVFMVLALYNFLQVPLGFLPVVINFLATVSLNELREPFTLPAPTAYYCTLM